MSSSSFKSFLTQLVAPELPQLFSRITSRKRNKGNIICHVTAVWNEGGEREKEPLTTININGHSPKSEQDFFVLNAVRSLSDAVITSAAIVREEPTVQTTIQGRYSGDLLEWREREWKKDPLNTIPSTFVLTSKPQTLDLKHPLFNQCEGMNGQSRVHILSSNPVEEKKREVREESGEREEKDTEKVETEIPIEVRVPTSLTLSHIPNLSLFSAIDTAVSESPHPPNMLPIVSIECGPRTTSSLYPSSLSFDSTQETERKRERESESPPAASSPTPSPFVDVLFLSQFTGSLSPLCVGGPFASLQYLKTYFTTIHSHEEGQWTFRCLVRNDLL